jgi:hypothetical protein
MKIHDTFHISLLRLAATDLLTEQIQFSSLSIIIKDEKKEYEINDILDSRYHYEILQYRVIWIDHSSNRAWYSKENFQKHSKEILNDYHQRYFTKFESNLRLIVIIETMLSQWIKNDIKKQNNWFKMFSTRWKRTWTIKSDLVKILSRLRT